MGQSLLIKAYWSEPVHKNIKTQPHHVNEVPVPSCAFKTEVLVHRKVPLLQAQGNEKQHQHANEHVKTVEPSQHVKR